VASLFLTSVVERSKRLTMERVPPQPATGGI